MKTLTTKAVTVLWNPEGQRSHTLAAMDGDRAYAQTPKGDWYALSPANEHGWRVGSVKIKDPVRIAEFAKAVMTRRAELNKAHKSGLRSLGII